MNARERILAVGVGGTLLIFGGFKITQWVVVQPFQAIETSLAEARERKAYLALRQVQESVWQKNWLDRTRRTLGTDPADVQTKFRTDVQTLLTKHGLTKDLTINSITPKTNKKTGITEIPLSITVKGKLDDLTSFLRDFYQRPYLVKIEKFTLDGGETQQKSRSSSRSRRGRRSSSRRSDASAEQLLSISGLKIATVVLPPFKKLKSKHIKSLDALDEMDPAHDWLAREDDDYLTIVSADIFGWAKQSEPKKIVVDEPGSDDPPPTPPAPTVDPRKDADKKRIVGVESRNGVAIVFVVDETQRDEPPKAFRTLEELDDGKLMLIHGLGLVVRVQPKSGAEDASATDYFYAIGTNFKQREQLDPARHPLIYQEMHRRRGS